MPSCSSRFLIQGLIFVRTLMIAYIDFKHVEYGACRQCESFSTRFLILSINCFFSGCCHGKKALFDRLSVSHFVFRHFNFSGPQKENSPCGTFKINEIDTLAG
jgi:hypothetical protein